MGSGNANDNNGKASSTPSDEGIRRVRAEQIDIVYRRVPAILAMNALVGGVLVIGLWRIVPSEYLLSWAAIMAAVVAARGALCWRYRVHGSNTGPDAWAAYLVIGTAVSGILWGAVGVVLFPVEPLEYQLLVLFILMGMGAGAVAALTAYLPAFYAFFPPALLPITVRMVQLGDPIYLALAFLMAAYVAGLLFFARNINKTLVESLSENEILVQALSRQKAKAEEANIAKSKFLAAASHDLRQPLHALMLFSSALGEHAKTAPLRAISANIKTSLEAMEELFNALLDISRLDADVLQPERSHFDFAGIAARLDNDFSMAAQTKGLALRCVSCDAILYTDPALLERILRNLVTNAIRYTDAGEVRIQCFADGELVRIAVTDTGIGIAPAQQTEIFKEFFQLDNPERDRTKGLGLGLAIVERVARLLDHELTLESTPARGSCFSIKVPRGDIDRVSGSTAPWVDALLGELTGLRVFVIDDEVVVRQGMQTLLETWGCQVALLGSEDEAAAHLHAGGSPPDALIVDYRLRDERTGAQAIERLRRQLGRDIPALIITGDTAPERLREARASGHQLAHKPVKPAMLRAFLHNVRKAGSIPPATKSPSSQND